MTIDLIQTNLTPTTTIGSDPQRTRRIDVRLKQGLTNRTLPKDLLIVGPAGTGKTFGTLSTHHVLCRDYSGLRVLICRQSRASLTESVLATFEDEILPADGSEFIAMGERRDHRSNYRYPNGSKIVLRGLDKPDRALSTAWDIVFVNEAIETEEDAWETLGSRLSRPGRDHRFGYLIGDTNPGDPAHWLKKRCDSGRTARWETTHAANPALFGKSGWTKAWEPYRERLRRLTGTRRKRLFEGLWAAGEGQWFNTFDESHISPRAVYDPNYLVHLSVDTGVHTGAVLWQVKEDDDGEYVDVLADYYNDGSPVQHIAESILAIVRQTTGAFDVGRYDPSGNSRSGFGGQTVASEYARAGLHLHPWPKYGGSREAGLTVLESFVAVSPTRLRVHPDCVQLINAFNNYKRKKIHGQYVDEPEDPQHPYEELIDALRSGLLDKYPDGRGYRGPSISTFGPSYPGLHQRTYH